MASFANQLVAVALVLMAISSCRLVCKAGGLLIPGYYMQTCPLAEEIVRQSMETVLYQDPTMAASLLRLHFHDCFVLGCDASVLLDDAEGIVSEKNAVPNLNSLRGFEVIDVIKALLEEACPLTVSCADILAIAARDAVFLRGGPSWEVLLGRKDSFKAATIKETNNLIPSPNSSLDTLIANFHEQGLDIVDLVSLSGSHTMGRSRCVSFKNRLYGPDPFEDYDHRFYTFFSSLRAICPPSPLSDNTVVPLDVRTFRLFDNAYYQNLLAGHGLLTSDNVLVSYSPGQSLLTDAEKVVNDLVWQYAYDQELFFDHFAGSIVKMGSINVLTGAEGEVRHSCRYVNSYLH